MSVFDRRSGTGHSQSNRTSLTRPVPRDWIKGHDSVWVPNRRGGAAGVEVSQGWRFRAPPCGMGCRHHPT